MSPSKAPSAAPDRTVPASRRSEIRCVSNAGVCGGMWATPFFGQVILRPALSGPGPLPNISAVQGQQGSERQDEAQCHQTEHQAINDSKIRLFRQNTWKNHERGKQPACHGSRGAGCRLMQCRRLGSSHFEDSHGSVRRGPAEYPHTDSAEHRNRENRGQEIKERPPPPRTTLRDLPLTRRAVCPWYSGPVPVDASWAKPNPRVLRQA